MKNIEIKTSSLTAAGIVLRAYSKTLDFKEESIRNRSKAKTLKDYRYYDIERDIFEEQCSELWTLYEKIMESEDKAPWED